MSGSAAAAVAAAASAAAAAAHFQPQSSSPRPGAAELGPLRRPRPPPPPPRPEPAAAGRLSPPGHGPLRAGSQGGGACGRAPGAGSVGASFQCQSIHHDHICHDDSDKILKVIRTSTMSAVVFVPLHFPSLAASE
ncbi:homeobox protein Hox-D13-like [Panthera tigris]|uniref:homeobox protein Hox-D13-like n=1 Tax=Panthera leo TaxID=9689 RepID=UPI001C6A3FA6|nr:homeobox protein Hox-D13-like [Panthera leo]XP_042820425.1 homeobox protein Hox-D13-like [Panthera tigris]